MELRPDYRISRVIKGGWQLAGDHGSVDRTSAIADMEAFVDAGITTFDCADIYHGVEEMIGDFIVGLRQRRGRELADGIRVHTKFVPDLDRLQGLTADEIEAVVDRSLRRLKIERLDLVQLHWWDYSLGDPVAAMAVLQRLQDKGKIRQLAVTNCDSDFIEQFNQAGFDIVSAQVQYSVLDRRPAASLARFAADNDLWLLCYGTLAGGFLTEHWLGQADPGFDFENRSLVKYRLIIDEFGPWSRFQQLLQALKSVAERHGVALSSVATRYVLEQPRVAAAIVGARYASYLPSTLEVFGFLFDDEDRQILDQVIASAAGPMGPVYGLERDRSGRHGSIMKYGLNQSPDAPVLASQGERG